jgi:hypothetical protein
MANKFVLVPDDIYRGLTTSSSSGNINLDFARRRLDELKRARLTPTAKNLLYNQELRRYLHLRSQANQSGDGGNTIRSNYYKQPSSARFFNRRR